MLLVWIKGTLNNNDFTTDEGISFKVENDKEESGNGTWRLCRNGKTWIVEGKDE